MDVAHWNSICQSFVRLQVPCPGQNKANTIEAESRIAAASVGMAEGMAF